MSETKVAVKLRKFTAKELRAKGRKQCWSPTQKFWMEVSLYLTTPFVRTPITPNMISTIWILLEIFSAFFLTLGNYKLNVIAIIIFNFVVLLGDHIDGNLARIKNLKSWKGPYLEQLGLFFGTPLIFLGLAVGNFIKNNNSFYLVISVIGVICWLFEKLIRINPLWFGPKKETELFKIHSSSSIFFNKKIKFFTEIFRNGQPFNFLFFCIVFDYTQVASLVYSFLFLGEFLRRLSSTILLLHKKDKENKNLSK